MKLESFLPACPTGGPGMMAIASLYQPPIGAIFAFLGLAQTIFGLVTMFRMLQRQEQQIRDLSARLGQRS